LKLLQIIQNTNWYWYSFCLQRPHNVIWKNIFSCCISCFTLQICDVVCNVSVYYWNMFAVLQLTGPMELKCPLSQMLESQGTSWRRIHG